MKKLLVSCLLKITASTNSPVSTNRIISKQLGYDSRQKLGREKFIPLSDKLKNEKFNTLIKLIIKVSKIKLRDEFKATGFTYL